MEAKVAPEVYAVSSAPPRQGGAQQPRAPGAPEVSLLTTEVLTGTIYKNDRKAGQKMGIEIMDDISYVPLTFAKQRIKSLVDGMASMKARVRVLRGMRPVRMKGFRTRADAPSFALVRNCADGLCSCFSVNSGTSRGVDG